MTPRTMEEEASDLSTASRVLHSLGETLREKLIEKPVPTTKTPLVFFFARGFMTYQAVIRLWEGGFWQDAAVLSRSLREASYQARWAAKCGDQAAGLFMQDHERNWRKVIRTISEVAAPDVKSKALELVADIKPDAELDVWWRNWWGKGKSICWLTKQIGANDAYLIEYAALSAFVHSSPAVLTTTWHRTTREADLRCAPGPVFARIESSRTRYFGQPSPRSPIYAQRSAWGWNWIAVRSWTRRVKHWPELSKSHRAQAWA